MPYHNPMKTTLLEYKTSHGFTYRDLSKLWGIPSSTIHHWASGYSKPRKKHARIVFARTKGTVKLEIYDHH